MCLTVSGTPPNHHSSLKHSGTTSRTITTSYRCLNLSFLFLTFEVLFIADSVFLWWAASCRTKDLLKTLNIKGLVEVLLFFITMATWRRSRQRLEEGRGVVTKYIPEDYVKTCSPADGSKNTFPVHVFNGLN